jgi:hypothetical protein
MPEAAASVTRDQSPSLMMLVIIYAKEKRLEQFTYCNASGSLEWKSGSLGRCKSRHWISDRQSLGAFRRESDAGGA